MTYFASAMAYLGAQKRDSATPTLFDLVAEEENVA